MCFCASQMVVYSLGMTLYWCVDYHLPQNQVRSVLFGLVPPFSVFVTIFSLPSRFRWVPNWRACYWACARMWRWGGRICWRFWRRVSFTTRPPCCLQPNASSNSWLTTSAETRWEMASASEFPVFLKFFLVLWTCSICLQRLILFPWLRMDLRWLSAAKWSGTDYTVRNRFQVMEAELFLVVYTE